MPRKIPRILAPFRPSEITRAGAPCTLIVKLADGSLLTADGNATVRSRDLGQTWGENQKIFAGVCGHPPISLLELRDDSFVVPVQYYVNGPLRCVIRPYVSRDDGQTWHTAKWNALSDSIHASAFTSSWVSSKLKECVEPAA